MAMFTVTLDLGRYTTKTVKKLFYNQILTRDEFIFELRDRGADQGYAEQVADIITDKRMMDKNQADLNSLTRMAKKGEKIA